MKSGPCGEVRRAPNGEEGASGPGWLVGSPASRAPGGADEGRSSRRDRSSFFPFVLFQSAGLAPEAAGSSQWTEKGADFKLARSLSPGAPGGPLCSFCGDPGQGAGAHGHSSPAWHLVLAPLGAGEGERMGPHGEESSMQGCRHAPQRLLGLPVGLQGGIGRSGGHMRCVTPIWPGCIRNGQAQDLTAKIQMAFFFFFFWTYTVCTIQHVIVILFWKKENQPIVSQGRAQAQLPLMSGVFPEFN